MDETKEYFVHSNFLWQNVFLSANLYIYSFWQKTKNHHKQAENFGGGQIRRLLFFQILAFPSPFSDAILKWARKQRDGNPAKYENATRLFLRLQKLLKLEKANQIQTKESC